MWVRLGDIGEVYTGETPPTSKNEYFGDYIPFLSPADFDINGNVIYGAKGLSKQGLEIMQKIPKNSVLVTCIGGLIGKACIVDRECTCNQQINYIIPYNIANYKVLFFIINSQYFQSIIKQKSTGTATPIINKTLFESIPIPIPPLEEQKHITKLLDNLFSLTKGLRVE